jgi:hypothetical protein
MNLAFGVNHQKEPCDFRGFETQRPHGHSVTKLRMTFARVAKSPSKIIWTDKNHIHLNNEREFSGPKRLSHFLL